MPMNKQIYVNLAVKDLARSKAFFAALGYGFNPQFSNEQGACMVVSENIFVMLLTEPFFAGFTSKPVADATQVTEVLVCLSCDSREQLEALVAKARAAGGSVPRPLVDHGFMVQHGFEDLDGHVWELVHMAGAPDTPAS
jgi:predicted lactoylglutathione lyase